MGICVIPALICSKWEFLNWGPMPELSSIIPNSPALSSWGHRGSRSAAMLETHQQHMGDFIANLAENAKVNQRRYHQIVEFLKDIHRTDLDWSQQRKTALQWLTELLDWQGSTQTAILGLNLPLKAWPSVRQLKIKPDFKFNICCDNINTVTELFPWDVEEYIPTMSTILISCMVNSRIKQLIWSIPESALSLGIINLCLSRSVLELRKFLLYAEHY